MNNIQLNQISKALQDTLIAGESKAVGELLDRAIEEGISLQVLYVEVLGTTLCAIGQLWTEGKVSIAQEHRATQILFDHLSRIRQTTRQRKSLGVKVVVSSLPGDFHILGGRIVADLMYLDGWDVDFLGADTPVDEIVRHSEEVSASLVGISVSSEEYFPTARDAIQKLLKCSTKPKIMLGGRGVLMKGEEAKKLGADVLVNDGNHAVAEARRIVGIAGSVTSLSQTLGEIGSRIHFNRKAQKMSQEKLAHASGLDRAYISSVENGKQNITIGALLKLSEALGIDLGDLINGPLN